MFIKLELKNFRKLQEKEIDFSAGLNGVFGANYTGKTSTLLALAVALAGPGFVRGYALVNRQATNFHIALTLKIGGVVYRIERTKDNAKLFKGEDLIASKHTQVNIEISKLLGMPVNDWLELRFVEQKEASAMFTAGASQLNKMIERVTGVQTISAVIEKLSTVASQAEATAAGLREHTLSPVAFEALLQQIVDVQTQIEQTVAAQTAVSEKLPTQTHAVKLLESDLTEHRRTLARLRDDLTQWQIVQKTVAATRDKVTRLMAELEKHPKSATELKAELEQCSARHEKITKQQTELRTLLVKRDAAQAAFTRASSELQNAQDKLAAIDVDTLTGRKEQLDLRKADVMAHLQSDQDTLKDMRRQLTLAQESLKTEACPTCGRAYEEHAIAEGLKQDLEKQVAILPESIRKADRAIQTLKSELEDVESQAAAVVRSLAQVDTLKSIIQHHQVKEKESATELQKLNEELPANATDWVANNDIELQDLTRTMRTLGLERGKVAQLAEDLAATELELERQEDSLATWEEKHIPSDLSELETAASGMERELQEARTLLTRLESESASLSSRKVLLTNQLMSFEATKTRQETTAAALQKHDARAEAAKGLQKFLRENRSRYVQAAWATILGRASRFVAAVTGGAISAVNRTEDGDFLFTEGEFQAGVLEASGAQAAIIGLSVQAALAEAVPSALDVFLCDEPTADMDAEHSAASLLALSNLTSQTVVISHHRFDETLCNNLIEL